MSPRPVAATALEVAAAEVALRDAGIVPQSYGLEAVVEAAVVVARVWRVRVDDRRLECRLGQRLPEVRSDGHVVAPGDRKPLVLSQVAHESSTGPRARAQR